MMKKILFVLAICYSISLVAQQESLGSMQYNVEINPTQTNEFQTKKLANSFDSTFYYLMDTLSLPILDDFSTDKFQKYDAKYDDTFVSDTLFHRLEFEGTPVAAGKKFSIVRTYRYVVDTTLDASDQVDTIPLLGVFHREYDLSVYPMTFNEDSLYPPYDLYDTINFVNDQDTIYHLDNVVQQDFARLFFVVNQDLNSIWVDHFAYHNYTKAINPFSLGIATMDGVDDKGIPYQASQTAHGIADYLTSKEIDLNVNPADSIYFSFLYQGGGLGEVPESNDSLIVEFYAPEDKEWNRIWSTEGMAMDTFFRAHLPVNQSKYLKTGFKFRFKNYANLSGSLDYWNIDYVQLRAAPGVGLADTILADVAWSMPINSLLKDFTSVPWKHYQNLTDKNSIFTDSMPSIIRNSLPIDAFDQGGNIALDEAPNTIIRNVPSDFYSDINNGLNYAPRFTVETFHDIKSTGYFFPDDPANDTFKIFPIVADLQTSSVQILENNDTTRFNQVFSNYYAYDDGTPEQTYGTIGAQSLFAYKFNALQEDSLVAVAMRFVRSPNEVYDNPFLLTVWNDNGGEPGDILYQDDFFNAKYPEYTNNHGGFYYYVMSDSMKLALPQTFYVGWRQIDHERLDIGFDRNTNQSDKMFFSTSNGITWSNSQFEGSVMMRPIINSKLNGVISVEDVFEEEIPTFSLYPNPVENQLNIAGDLSKLAEIQVFDLSGKMVYQTLPMQQIDVSNLTRGMYLVHLKTENGASIQVEKIIVR